MPKYYFVLLFILSAQSALSQILNVESVRKSANTDKDLIGNLDFKFSTNNRNSTPDSSSVFTQFGVRSNISLLKDITAYSLIGDITYNSLAGNAFISAGYVHYRNHFYYKSRFSMEQYNQWQYDAGRGLANRWLTGVGGRFELLDTGKFALAIGSGIMLEYEAWDGEAGRVEKLLPKSSNYIAFTGKFNEAVSFNFTNYYQVGYDGADDLYRQRFSTDFSISVKFTEKLLFTTSFTSTYDAQPIIPLREFLFSVDNGLRLKF